MYYAIGLLYGDTWVWATERTQDQVTIQYYMNHTFKDVHGDYARVFAGLSMASLDRSLEFENQGRANNSLTFTHLKAKSFFTTAGVRQLEMEYGLSDRDVPYTPTLPTSVHETSAWVALMDAVAAGAVGGKDDGEAASRAPVS